MKTSIVLMLLVSALLNAALAILERGQFDHVMLVFWLIIYVAAPAFVVGLVALALSLAGSWPNARTVALWAFGLAMIAGSTLISIPIGSALLLKDIDAAKRYCEDLIPPIEAYRTREGTYPRDLSSMTTPSERPSLLRNGYYHRSHDGSSYSFSIINPGGMLNGFDFDSKVGKWREWD